MKCKEYRVKNYYLSIIHPSKALQCQLKTCNCQSTKHIHPLSFQMISFFFLVLARRRQYKGLHILCFKTKIQFLTVQYALRAKEKLLW
ncbi:unnamed protein product [Prunus brigantina]